MSDIKFRSLTGNPIHVANTLGHAAQVGADWVELHPTLHREALMRGCVSNQMVAESISPQVQGAPLAIDTKNLIREAIQQMLAADAEGDFDAATGLPSLKTVRKLAGFNVKKDEMIQVWNDLQNELDNEPQDDPDADGAE